MKITIMAFAATIILSICVGPVLAQDTRVLAKAEQITGDRFTVSVTTPRGAHVYGVSRPSTAVLNAVDRGLADLFAVARKNEYSRRLNYQDYTVYIARADRTADYRGQYSPDIQIPVAQYAGTIFDKGGYMYAAGMVIANDPCSFLIAEHTKDFDRLSNVVRYEGEHLVLYHNDRARFAATADHSRGGAHPLLQ